MLTHRGLGVVLQDLAEMGYDAEWGVFTAKESGFQHKRERMFIVAYSAEVRRGYNCAIQGKLSMESTEEWEARTCVSHIPFELCAPIDGDFTYRKDDGVAAAVDRFAACGNGWVPQVAVRAWRELTGRLSA